MRVLVQAGSELAAGDEGCDQNSNCRMNSQIQTAGRWADERTEEEVVGEIAGRPIGTMKGVEAAIRQNDGLGGSRFSRGGEWSGSSAVGEYCREFDRGRRRW